LDGEVDWFYSCSAKWLIWAKLEISYARKDGVVAADSGSCAGLKLDRVEIGAPVSHAYLSVSESIFFSLKLFLCFKKFVLAWSWQVLFPFPVHNLFYKGSFLGGLDLFN
jgi:hypothetical protein